ncbi:hypothetical protein O6H91_09G039600 [Diphasiastrum complanatum]|uniref:Uncharacterized protein n=1 Tax=Diphasiastrum complanatum TaxID=34168 RepID=A0ACC2CNG9_DIPCM|nr:hypothetical protein O6H91_09G039600 [Diphasiastrum complanatum]
MELEKLDMEQRENDDDDNEDEPAMDVKVIGPCIKKAGKGKLEKMFYQSFELDGVQYDVEDSVLVTPEQRSQKPYVAIIKEIKQLNDDSIMVTGQWFYRPEEADKKGGGSWVSSDARELFYSFHRDDVAAESVMHKCVVHFIPPHKQLPARNKHPGFIVRKVYDTVEKKLWNLTDKDYEDSKQKEIDLLVMKTQNAVKDLADLETEEPPETAEKFEKSKRLVRKRSIAPLSIATREDAANEAAEPSGNMDTPGSGRDLSYIHTLLQLHDALTGMKARDAWLEKIVENVKAACFPQEQKAIAMAAVDAKLIKGKDGKSEGRSSHQILETLESAHASEKLLHVQIEGELAWPADVITASTALEKTVFSTLSTDMHKYNLKMRQLAFNLKKYPVLAQRLVKKELEPLTVLNMSPAELKDGYTAAEKRAQEPQEPQTLQMADVRCAICAERQVRVKDIIHVGFGDRYQLECLKCGHSWYASRDSISSLSIETVTPSPTVGTAPWATSKFDYVEKELNTPKPTDKSEGQKQGFFESGAS